MASGRLQLLSLSFAVACAGGDSRPAADRAGAASPCGAPPRPDSARVVVHLVNHGTHGMSASVRWALSPDRCSLLVVEDPVSVEADPLPNGFLLASERGPSIVQRDSVWDVAPSPDWSRLVYGRAYGVLGRERDSIPPAEWEELARRVGLATDVVRRGAFHTSGMSLAYGVSRPVVVDVASGAERPLERTGGWRVAWSRDGGALLVGGAPSATRDDSPPSRWDVVDAGTPAARSASERARSLDSDVTRAEVVWTEGPTIDISVVRPTPGAPIVIDDGRLESREGVIRLMRTGATAAGSQGKIVGPGVALMATRGGRFIAALVPDPARREHDPPLRLVVYQLRD